MNTYQVKDFIEKLIELLKPKNNDELTAIKQIFGIAALSGSLQDQVHRYLTIPRNDEGIKNLTTYNNDLRVQLSDAVINRIRGGVNLYTIGDIRKAFLYNLTSYKNKDGIKFIAVDKLVAELETYFTFYDSIYKNNSDYDSAIKIVYSANRIKNLIEIISSSFEVIKDRIDWSPVLSRLDSQYGLFSMVLYEDLDLIEIGEYLILLDDIYNLACKLLDISSFDYPLQIIKIETGTVRTQLAGYLESVKVMVLSVKLIADLHSKYFSKRTLRKTDFNQKAAEQKFKEDAIKGFIGVMDQVKASGLGNKDTKKLSDETINEYVATTRKLMKFNSVLEVNGEKLPSVGSHEVDKMSLLIQQNKLLKKQNRLLLKNLAKENEGAKQIKSPSQKSLPAVPKELTNGNTDTDTE